MLVWQLISMKATTIKLAGELLTAIERAKPFGESVTSFVRKVLRKSRPGLVVSISVHNKI